MKRTLLQVCILTAMSIGTTATMNADTFTVDGINYSLLEDGSGVEVAQGSYSGDIVIPATVKYGNITYKVVALGKRSFQDTEITSVTLPKTIRIIKDLAFNASDVVTINLNEGLEEIKDGAFSVARSLENISEIPASCVSIDPEGIFMMNDKLKAINVSDDNPMYKSVDGVLYSKSGKTAIGYPNGRGTEYDIPEGVDSIGTNFLNTNQNMTRVSFPSTLKVVGRSAFIYCTKMVTNNLPEGLKEIGASAFSNCRVMETTVPGSVTFLGMTSFNNCYKVSEVTVSDKLTTWGNQTFYQNKALNKLTIMPNPENITVIPQYAFQGATVLEEVVVPEGYTAIEGRAFTSCGAVKKVDLPSTLTSIGVSAFGTSVPESIIVRAAVPPTYENQTYYMFHPDCLETVNVYVPDESIDAYKAAWMWGFFKNYKPLSELSGVETVGEDIQDEIISTQYYNLQGVEVAEPSYRDGKIYIVRDIYRDGSVKTQKKINR